MFDRKRREFITLLGGAAAAWPLATRAQESGRTYRLGSLQFSPRGAPWHVAFFDALRRQGFVEGQNLVGDPDGYSLRVDQLAAHAAELVKAKVDIIIAAGDPNVRAAQLATKTLPILAIAEDLVDSGFVASLAKPGGNTTGVSILTSGLNGKRQEILLEAVPGTRIAALADDNSISPQKLQELDDAARAHGVALSMFRVTKEDEIPGAPRCGKEIRRGGAERPSVVPAVQCAQDNHPAGRGAAPARNLSMAGNHRRRWPHRLRSAYHPNLRGDHVAAVRRVAARHQARGHPRRTADKIRSRDQPQDRQSARHHVATGIHQPRRQCN